MQRINGGLERLGGTGMCGSGIDGSRAGGEGSLGPASSTNDASASPKPPAPLHLKHDPQFR